MSSACLCLATIDQYFATCTRPRWQQWCNIKLAHRLVAICSFLFLLEQIPSLPFYNHVISPLTSQTTCTITNANFALFNNYFTVVTMWFIVPLFITVFFGSLAYRNVQQIAYRTNPLVRRELDKQLTVMVLVQVLVNFIVLVPYLILFLIVNNDNVKQNSAIFPQINFAYTVTVSLYYTSFAIPFYVYICTSERFRRQLIYVIFKMHLSRMQQRLVVVNQIAPQP